MSENHRTGSGASPAPLAGAARLEIDLGAIVANWRLLCAKHTPGAVGAVVKANAYGLGAAEIVPRLHTAGCRHFFTAHLEEALALRPLLPDRSMLAALNGLLPVDAGAYRAHGITPVLGSVAEIALWRAEAARAEKKLDAILHIDTGMARLGLTSGEVAALAADPDLLAGISLRYLMTHLVSAECRDDPLNEHQLVRFADAAARLPKAARSLANSSGIFLGPRFVSDLARPGAALYGINPTPDQPNPMYPAVRLSAQVLALREVEKGTTIGYNETWRAAAPSRIATIGVGYADGWPRSLSNRGSAVFDGRRLPLVGRVSMDLTTFDATGHPGLRPGDWLELIGPGQPLEDVAAVAGTNAYEILTALGARYQRVERDDRMSESRD
ncbi:MAG: alanine racemase [Acetobacteraceae bacterium]